MSLEVVGMVWWVCVFCKYVRIPIFGSGGRQLNFKDILIDISRNGNNKFKRLSAEYATDLLELRIMAV